MNLLKLIVTNSEWQVNFQWTGNRFLKGQMELFGKRARVDRSSIQDDPNVDIKSLGDDVKLQPPAKSYSSFRGLGLSDWICSSVSTMGYKKPTEIQISCIPAILSGRDVLACAETGSGEKFENHQLNSR